MSRPLIVAHRGASYLAPENTLVSFRTAKTLGADGIEMDVQMTKDKKLVIAHDFVTDRVSNAHYDIFNTDFDTLRQLDFGSWKSPDYAGEKIPTLEEVLEIGRDMKMMHIELKPYFDRDKDFVARVLDAVVNMGCEDKVVLTSFQYDLLRQIKEQMPEMKTAALFLNMESTHFPPPSLWEDLGLTNGDPMQEKIASVQSLSEMAALVENPDELDGENGPVFQYYRDRFLAMCSNFPGKNLLEIFEDYVRQIDTMRYVSQFDFPVDYIGPTYYGCFRDTKLISKIQAKGFQAAPWPMFTEDRRELRSLLRMNPEVIVTNQPELLLSVMEARDSSSLETEPPLDNPESLAAAEITENS